MENQTQHTKIAVLGAGAWGTALAAHLSRKLPNVILWGRDAEQIAHMQATRINQKYLPELTLPSKLNFASALGEWLRECDIIVVAVPSQFVCQLLEDIAAHVQPETRIVISSKGANQRSDGQIEFLTETSQRVLGESAKHAVLSGPSFAKELVIGIPTSVVIASQKLETANELADLFHTQNFRVYPSADPIGVQLASIGKNIIAVAAGVVDGMQLGDNTRAALICRGLNELIKLGNAMQLDPQSFTGLAGIGDIILTCTCDASRNRRFGLALGSGLSATAAAQQVGKLSTQPTLASYWIWPKLSS